MGATAMALVGFAGWFALPASSTARSGLAALHREGIDAALRTKVAVAGARVEGAYLSGRIAAEAILAAVGSS